MVTTITKSLPSVETGEEKQVPAPNKKAEQRSTLLATDSFVSSNGEKANTSSDRKFSFIGALKNLGKGMVSPITATFSSTKNFLISAGMIIGIGVLMVVTGGAVAPALVAFGLAFGAFQGINACYKIATAKNGDDVEKAFLDIGTAITTLIPSVLGARAALTNLRINAKFMTRSEAIYGVFKETPRSIKASYKITKESYLGLLEEFANKRQIKPIVDVLYNEEIDQLARSLGVSKNELCLIMPKKAKYNFLLRRLFEGGNVHIMKPRITIPPSIANNSSTFNLSRYGPTIRDRVAFFVTHEVRHSYPRIISTNQLTLEEHLQTIENVISSVEKSDPNFTRGELFRSIFKLNAKLRHCSRTGERIKALNIPKNKEMRLKAEQFVQDEIECGLANLKAKNGSTDAYHNTAFEVDARQYSMSRRLEMLIDDVRGGNDPENWVQRFRHLRKDLDDEYPGFKEPTRVEFRERVKLIKSQLDEAKQKLLAKGLSQEDLDKPYEIAGLSNKTRKVKSFS